MTKHAIGTFDVQMTPLSDETLSATTNKLAGMSLAKQFQGELQGKSAGQMLTAMTATEGSAGYVAIEQVTGRLQGRQGSFVLQHYGIMGGGEQNLTITIVPDSGTDELAGVSGTMSIAVDENGKHTYDLAYSL
jgi:hypothetical protein